ncbi:MAG: transposase [Clostridia bacterium]|nr:transposase [Clostridia bacterium]
MELPKRKQIRLKDYDYTQNNAYFITVCTHKKARLFGDIVGATLCGRPNNPDKMIEKWILEMENKYPGLKIDKYVIMPDHVHFILFNHGITNEKTGDHTGSPLPQIMGWFKTMTTNEYIRGVKNGLYQPFDKHLWHRSYYDHAIRCDRDYEEIWQYIDENPLRWFEKHKK